MFLFSSWCGVAIAETPASQPSPDDEARHAELRALRDKLVDAMNRADARAPWVLSFSYARALQDPVMRTWRGDPQNAARAQQAFDHRLAMNSLAREGRWSEAAERAAA